MTKAEFMAQLAQELNDLPQEDVQDALQYYTEYFEEAGPENEQQVIADLGGAHKVANIIRANMGLGAKTAEEQPKHERYGAQRAPYDYTHEAQAAAGAGASYYYSGSAAPRTAGAHAGQQPGDAPQYGTRQSNTWVWVLLAVVTAPVWLGLAGGLLGIVVGIFAAVLAMIVAGAGMIAAGVVALFGVFSLAHLTFASLCLYYGACAACIGVGMLLVMGFSKLLQLCIRAVGAIFHSLQRTWNGNRGVAA